MIEPRWIKRGRVKWDTSIYRHDGDSFLVDFDLGHGIYLLTNNRADRQVVRLLDVDCPERYKVGGSEATAFTEQWMTLAEFYDDEWYLEIQTVKRDSFGRWLSYVRRLLDGRYLHEDLIAAGHHTGREW